MSEHQPHTLILNRLSLIGLPLAIFGFVAGGTLIVLDMFNPVGSPYLSIFIYLIIPAILILGLLLILIGVFRERARRRKYGLAAIAPMPQINLNDRRQFIAFLVVVIVTMLFFILSAIGGYRAYHFTESVAFCGVTCHSVMKPEYTAYKSSPHANVRCTECHIGPGADWFVKSKMSGIRQVFAVAGNTYSRPIHAPVHNLRPANETCYTCHWPQKFFGALELNRTYYRSDENNSAWTIQMLINVGGGDKEHGRKKGIHAHMAIDNQIEYIATDEKRLEIPWVRQTDSRGQVTVYQTTNKRKALSPEAMARSEIRTMDCIDCHNRPSHQYHSPERILNEALSAGILNPDVPFLKHNAIEAISEPYTTEAQAFAAIRERLSRDYPDGGESTEKTIQAVQKLYSRNFFPEMKVSWREYPDHIGHLISPGCFRCHDGNHVSAEGKVITHDCAACHTIIAQGPGRELSNISSGGLEFQHPEDIGDEWKESRCDDCHNGLPVL